jgi:predicted acetyltransferase
MTFELRPVLADRADEAEAFDLLLTVDVSAFGDEPEPESLNADRLVAELDRAVLAWDGDQPVGSIGIYSLDMSVPGGSVKTAGVTWVGVVPTHRRRGVMNALMNDRHQAIYDAEQEPLAALWASQSPIYGRYGYGVASRHLSAKIERRHGAMSRAPIDPTLRLQMVEPADDAKLTQPVYDRVREERPGMPAMNSNWHTWCVQDVKADREGASKLKTVVVDSDDGPLAYVRYAVKHAWDKGYADGSVQIRQFAATTPASGAALWRHLFSLDLFERVAGWNLPSDDPIQAWLDEPRHAQNQLGDALYVRLIRLDQALEQRTYSADLDVVIDVLDPWAAWNAGRWHLSGGKDGASCARTTRSPDVTLDVSALSAIYMGSTSLNELFAAGWIDEHRSGSVQKISQAFSHSPAAWSPFVF